MCCKIKKSSLTNIAKRRPNRPDSALFLCTGNDLSSLPNLYFLTSFKFLKC